MTGYEEQLRSEVISLTKAWQAEGRYTPRPDSWMRSFDIEFSRELASRGLIGMTWPKEFGGRGLTNRDRLAVTEELLRAGAPVAAHWMGDRQIGPAILRHGNGRLQNEILPLIVGAQAVFCLCMSEPEAGSDLAAVRTTATRVPGGWALNGHKIWTSHAHRATHAYVLARTSTEENRHQGLSEFIVDMASGGVAVTPILDLAGEHHFNEVHFTNVFVPEHRLIGTVGNGWAQVVEQLSFERGGPERVLSTYPALVELLAVRADEAPEVVPLVGSLVARLAVLRRLCWDVAEKIDRGYAPVTEAAALKYLGNRFERDVVEALRLFPANDSPAADTTYGGALLASTTLGVRGGAADVLLSIIARRETRP